MSKKRVVLAMCSVGLLAAFAAGCSASAKLGTPEIKAATPEPPAPPPPPPAPEPPKPAEPPPVEKPAAAARVQVTNDHIVITEQILFDQNKATIKPESNGLLDDIAKTLKEKAEIKKVQVEGHTSAEGDAGANQKLSDDRAKAVVKALTERGVDAKRLVAKGFGETKPLGTNDTPAGRVANRRVEFLILDPAPKK